LDERGTRLQARTVSNTRIEVSNVLRAISSSGSLRASARKMSGRVGLRSKDDPVYTFRADG